MLGLRCLRLLCLSALLAGPLSACAGGPLLTSLAATPARITPNGDRVDDSATIAYSLASRASVSIYLLGEDGQRHVLREGQPRPTGSYEASFAGAVQLPGEPAQRQVVPAGTYQVVVEAADDSGRREERRTTLTVADPDRSLPALDAVAALPGEISPYDPDLPAETRISYSLAEEAMVTLYVVEPDGRRSRLTEPARQAAGAHSQVWDGLIRNKVPRAGTYGVVVRAEDAAGNASERATAVTISGTEEPDASIVRVDFSPRKIISGGVIKVTITVRNTGTVTLRTHGPDPGYEYTTLDTFASVEGGRYADKPRLWRVGVDWAGGLGSEGARYPYRWGLGKDLAPGEEVTVEGYIRVLEEFPRLRMYAGLIHEKVGYHVDKVGQQIIEVSK